eukprot:1154651-Pelagomonas_calceolata.AAC.4
MTVAQALVSIHPGWNKGESGASGSRERIVWGGCRPFMVPLVQRRLGNYRKYAICAVHGSYMLFLTYSFWGTVALPTPMQSVTLKRLLCASYSDPLTGAFATAFVEAAALFD